MIELVCEPQVTSGWEIAAAIGTIAGALFTAAAIITAFVVATRDRRAADAAIRQQVKAADDRQARELSAAFASRTREHEVGLLLQLQNQMALFAAYKNMPQQAAARELGRGLLLALDDATDLVATRHVFASNEPAFSEMPRFDKVRRIRSSAPTRRQSAHPERSLRRFVVWHLGEPRALASLTVPSVETYIAGSIAAHEHVRLARSSFMAE